MSPTHTVTMLVGENARTGTPETIVRARGRGRQPLGEPAKLISPMIERFMATDRAFAKARRGAVQLVPGSAERSG
ncbi:DUF2274 domain-containing protein [Bradyrhizobium sp. CCGUVB1N3]|uniref:DUF2274 domain-containing protein n=1 Tax=Bradyrhizobium sp. CCGUVB1N3 TaxID=2949629 RepID=UPI0035322693